MFEVGQAVVCVDAETREWNTIPSPFTHLGVYRVRTIGWYEHWEEGPAYVVEIDGAPSPPLDETDIEEGVPPGWDAGRFRPIFSATTDFTAMIRRCTTIKQDA